MKALVITLNEWHKIVQQIAKHHPKSVWMVRSKMRKVLGFTTREHTEWVEDGDISSGFKKRIHLDFYNEQQRTMFLLKYGDWIRQETKDR